MRLKILLLLFTLTVQGTVSAQVVPDSSGFSKGIKVSPLKLSFIGGMTAAGIIYGYGVRDNFWYSGEKSDFHTNLSKDKKFLFYTDKFRHLFISNVLATTYSELFQWAGVEYESSLLWGGLVTFSYLTFVEIRDGFSRNSYFSFGDLAADLLGSSFPYLREKLPILNSFEFKISYPSTGVKYSDESGIEANGWEITNNWLSIDVHSLLPKSAKKYYPAFLNIAVGTNTNMYGPGEGGNTEIYLSLDWNIKQLPGEGKFWRFLKKMLNFYHFPAPAVRIHPSAVWYGLKF